jgi:serine/threonine protein kinase
VIATLAFLFASRLKLARKDFSIIPEHVGVLRATCEVLHKINSPDLVNFYGAFFPADGDMHVASCVTEFMGVGSLTDVLHRIGRIDSEPVLATIAQSALRGLAYLWGEHGLRHSAFTPGNVLVDMEGNVKLADAHVSNTVDNLPRNLAIVDVMKDLVPAYFYIIYPLWVNGSTC